MWNETAISDYRKMIIGDKDPSSSPILAKFLAENPKCLDSEIEREDASNYSVISLTLNAGNFYAADFILKQNGRFRANADPTYCGKEAGGIDALQQSAGVNFYLALTTLQFYAENNRLNELVTVNATLQQSIIRKTYYSCLYWDDSGTARPAVIEQKECNPESDVKDYQEETAVFFMKIAYKAFQAENQLKNSTSLTEKQRAHTILGECYLRMAYMEDSCRYAFYYLLDKAKQHYDQAPLENQDHYVNKINNYIAQKAALFELQRAARQEPLSSRPEGDCFRTSDEWKEYYRAVSQPDYAIGADVAPSLTPDLEQTRITTCQQNVLRHLKRQCLSSSAALPRITAQSFWPTESSFITPPKRSMRPGKQKDS